MLEFKDFNSMAWNTERCKHQGGDYVTFVIETQM